MYSKIKEYYEKECDENNRLTRSKMSSVEYYTTLKYITDICPKGAKVLDACAGTGVYSLPLAEMGYRVSAGDLVKHNVDKLKQKHKNNPILDEIFIGNITDLSMFNDNRFDVVLNLGSYYHLRNEEDRAKSLNESLRVLKPGGYYFLAYINKYSNYVKFNYMMKDNFNIFEDYLKNGYNGNDDVFYATTPEEIELLMPKFGLIQTHHLASDGLKFIMKDTVNSFNDDEFDRYLKKHYEMCEVKSLLGYSEHGLYIGKKF